MASSASFQQIYHQQSPFSVIDFGTRKIEENTIKKRQTLTGPTASGLHLRTCACAQALSELSIGREARGRMQGGEWDGGVPPLSPSPCLFPTPSSFPPSFPQTGNRPSMAAAADADDAGALPPLPFMSGNVVTGDRERVSERGRRRSQSSGMKILLQ